MGSIDGAISQAFDTTAGTQYEVRFDLAGNLVGPPTIKTVRVAGANDSADFTFNTTGHTLANMGYETHTFLFGAVGPTTTLAFTSLTGGTGGFGPVIDNVRVAPVSPAIAAPEPASLILLCSGLLGLAWARHRKV
jgi:hypothetical protein